MKIQITLALAAVLFVLSIHAEKSPQADTLQDKLEAIVLPDLAFKDTPLRTAVEELRSLSFVGDSETDPKKRGVNIVIKLGPESRMRLVTTNLTKPTLGQALEEVAKQAKCKVIVESRIVSIVPIEE